MTKLDHMFAQVLKNEDIQKRWTDEVLQKVRILVVGRSGVGKTTLLRLMIGEEGPQNVSEGTAGVQDINKEFTYTLPEHGLPLVLHDSNGIDVKGQVNLQMIEQFLKVHQQSEEFSEHIHLVWYVISAVDTRIADDAGLMELISKFQIPMVLIMTFNDYNGAAEQNANEAILDKLVCQIQSKETRRDLKKNVVKMGNRVNIEANTCKISVIRKDTEGLKLLSQRTNELLSSGKLKLTWAACQAVDNDAKLDASAEAIAHYGQVSFYVGSVAGLIPFARAVELATLFLKSLSLLCKIWKVPPSFKDALIGILYFEEAAKNVLRSALVDVGLIVGAGLSILASTITLGVGIPTFIATLATSGSFTAKAYPISVKIFALQTIAAILFAKCAQENGSLKLTWDGSFTKEKSETLYKAFFENVKYQRLLKKIIHEDHSNIDTALHKKKVKRLIKAHLVDIYSDLTLHRGKSLFNVMGLSPADWQGTVESFALNLRIEVSHCFILRLFSA